MIRKVLIIEDEENLMEMLKINLQKEGYEIFTAPDGEEGLHLAYAKRPDVIFLNIKLPGIDGWQVCQRLKSSPETRDIKVIFVSASAQQTDRNKAAEAGGDGFVSKPFNINDILRKLD